MCFGICSSNFLGVSLSDRQTIPGLSQKAMITKRLVYWFFLSGILLCIPCVEIMIAQPLDTNILSFTNHGNFKMFRGLSPLKPFVLFTRFFLRPPQQKEMKQGKRQHGAGEHQRGSGRGSLEEFGVTVVNCWWFLYVSKGNVWLQVRVQDKYIVG